MDLADYEKAPEPTTSALPGAWPGIDRETLVWVSRSEGASALDRFDPTPAEYEAAVPPLVAARSLPLGARVGGLARAAENELIRFDAAADDEMVGFAPLLLRSEAAASSQIEHLTASARAIFTAEIGDTGQRNATEIVSNTRAMQSALELADDLTPESVRAMHRVLMADTNHTPGQWRREAVWIGTSARSPVGATFIAPFHERVPLLMHDVMAFARRDDLPILAQVAVVHAQFETIHPFTDGNGRVGRALVQAMLRGKNVTRNVVVPVSAGLLTDIGAYHDALTAYRAGDVGPIVEQVAMASGDAIQNATVLLTELRSVGEKWRQKAQPRQGSQLDQILKFARRQPVFTAAMIAAQLGIAAPNVYPTLRKLHELGILAKKTEYKLGLVWRANDVLVSLDRFAERAGRRD